MKSVENVIRVEKAERRVTLFGFLGACTGVSLFVLTCLEGICSGDGFVGLLWILTGYWVIYAVLLAVAVIIRNKERAAVKNASKGAEDNTEKITTKDIHGLDEASFCESLRASVYKKDLKPSLEKRVHLAESKFCNTEDDPNALSNQVVLNTLLDMILVDYFKIRVLRYELDVLLFENNVAGLSDIRKILENSMLTVDKNIGKACNCAEVYEDSEKVAEEVVIYSKRNKEVVAKAQELLEVVVRYINSEDDSSENIDEVELYRKALLDSLSKVEGYTSSKNVS